MTCPTHFSESYDSNDPNRAIHTNSVSMCKCSGTDIEANSMMHTKVLIDDDANEQSINSTFLDRQSVRVNCTSSTSVPPRSAVKFTIADILARNTPSPENEERLEEENSTDDDETLSDASEPTSPPLFVRPIPISPKTSGHNDSGIDNRLSIYPSSPPTVGVSLHPYSPFTQTSPFLYGNWLQGKPFFGLTGK